MIAARIPAINPERDRMAARFRILGPVDLRALAVLIDMQFGTQWKRPNPIHNPDKLAVVMDHALPAPIIRDAAAGPQVRKFVADFGIEHFYDVGRHGICHQVIAEKGLASGIFGTFDTFTLTAALPSREVATMPVTRCGRFGHATRLEGRWTTAERQDSPLLVCLHGGGFDSRYFDAPGCALLKEACAAGFPVVSLNRPGYPANDESARRQPSFTLAAGIIGEVITNVWEQLGVGRPGIVLVGHSIGAAVAVHVAAAKTSWPLLGLAISGVGEAPAPVIIELLQQVPTDIVVTMPPDLRRPLFYGPDWTLKTTTLADIADLGVSNPSADLVEINTKWAGDLPKVAPLVEVPVHYVLAEFDGLWEASADRVGTFARHFSSAPFVEASLWRCVGHNIEHHRLGEAYARALLAFAERCAMETRRPKA